MILNLYKYSKSYKNSKSIIFKMESNGSIIYVVNKTSHSNKLYIILIKKVHINLFKLNNFIKLFKNIN